MKLLALILFASSLTAQTCDSRGLVVFSDPSIEKILGPLPCIGKTAWPWFDDRAIYQANAFGALQAVNKDVWNTALTGTISATKSGTTINGSVGTRLRTEFCGGTGTGNGSYLIVWYPTGTGSFGRWPVYVAACSSETRITIGTAFPFDSVSGLRFARMTPAEVGYWIGGASNTNFYDAVLMFYILYYRTGTTTYRDYARTLADRWWTMPWMDEGRTCRLDGVLPCLFPRNRSETGLILRALDGRADMWPGLRLWAGHDLYFATLAGQLYDIREQAYTLSNLSLIALLDPDPSSRATYATGVGKAIKDIWEPQQQPNGNWINPTFGNATWNGATGTVAVVQGSNIVTGTNTNWTAAMFSVPTNRFWTTNGPTITSNADGDAIVYSTTFIDATHIRTSPAYAGPTASGRGWQINNLNGFGTQPFMMGVVGRAMWHASQALTLAGDTANVATARRMVTDSVRWIRTYGYYPELKGLYYGRGYVGCEPDPYINPNCNGYDAAGGDPAIQSVRFLAAEVMFAVAQAYLIDQSPDTKTLGDLLFGGLYGGSGGPDSDSNYVWDILGRDANPGWAVSTQTAKYPNFAFGWGGGASYPAARNSTVQPPTSPSNITISTDSLNGDVTIMVCHTTNDGTCATITVRPTTGIQ